MPPEYPGALAIGEEEKRAAMEVLDSQSLFRYYGPHLLGRVDQFEKDFALAQGSRFSLAVSSGTAALHCALGALRIGPGDEVLIPAFTWVATMMAVVAVGATPVPVEIDDTFNLDPADVEARITPRTRAILVVHMGGVPAQIDALCALARRRGLPVVEDCAQACGASFGGRALGTFGVIGTFSLQLHKIITAGEGGAITTDDAQLYERAVRFHDMGLFRRSDRTMQENQADFQGPGLNLRLSEIQGAILVEQLKKRAGILDQMRRNNARLRAGIAGLAGVAQRRLPDAEGQLGSTLTLLLPTPERAARFRDALNAEGVTCSQPEDIGGHSYRSWTFLLEQKKVTLGMYPRTDALLARAVSMHTSPLLSEGDCTEVIDAIRKVAHSLSGPGGGAP